MVKEFFIPGNVPSKKNSHGAGINKSGAAYVFKRSNATDYEKQSYEAYKAHTEAFKEIFKDQPKPWLVGIYYIRATNHRLDFTNKTDTVQDMMVTAGWIDDDDLKNLHPIPLGFEVNKECQGVKIIPIKELKITYL